MAELAGNWEGEFWLVPLYALAVRICSTDRSRGTANIDHSGINFSELVFRFTAQTLYLFVDNDDVEKKYFTFMFEGQF